MTANRAPRILSLVLSAIALQTAPRAAEAAEVYAELEAGGEVTSNVYMDRTREWDVVAQPRVLLGLSLAELAALEYEGEVDVFARHADLFFHRHRLGASLSPSWGADGEDRFEAELSAGTQQHASAYESINFVEPALELTVELEPAPFFRWSISQRASYRFFYNDTASDSFDLWTYGELAFTPPSRTTVGPRAGYGLRFFPRQDDAETDDTADQQIEVGLHASQALTDNAGLQLDYAYLHNIGDNALIARKLTETEFSYLGEEFLFTGHQVELGYKQMFDSGVSFGVEARFEARTYDGWIVDGETGSGNGTGNGSGDSETTATREDQRLAPRAWLEYAWSPPEGASRAVPEITVTASYEYLRQWSNDRQYDADRHTAGLSLTLSW